MTNMNEKDIIKELMILKNKQKDSYNYDLYEFDYIIPRGTRTNGNYIKDTIELFLSFHNDFDTSNLLNNISLFEEIIQNDKIINIHNKIILKEFYSILLFIYQTQVNLKTINNKSYPNNYFAKINTDKRAIKRYNVPLCQDRLNQFSYSSNLRYFL